MASIVRSMTRSIARDNMLKAGYVKVVKSGFFQETLEKVCDFKEE